MMLLILLLFTSGSHGQFAEIASLATSFLGPGLSGLAGAAGPAAAAGGAAGALGQIGQLYQLAQGALQLTSTGVGVLNQATEGNWFPAALETAAKNQESFRKNGGGLGGLPMPGLGGGGGGFPGLMPLPGLGPLGPTPGKTGGAIGPEFGTSFPAPDVDDYNEDLDILTTPAPTTKKPVDPFEEIEDKDLERPNLTTTPRAPVTTTEPVTLFPDEEEFETLAPTPQPKKQIRIELPKENKEEEDYFDQVRKEEEAVVEITNTEKNDGDELLLPIPPKSLPSVDAAAKTIEEKKDKNVPNLEKLVDTLRQKSSLTEEEIQELVGQVESNGKVEKPPNIDFNSGVQNINEKMADHRKRILEASRKIDANWRGQPVQSHRSNLVTLSPTPPPTPAPFVHSTVPVSEEILSNRLEREITPHVDKDLLPQPQVKVEKPIQKVLPPRTIATLLPTVPTSVPVQRPVTSAPPPQPQPTPQAHYAPQQQYYYPQNAQQVPPSFPISQQQAQYQQYYQQYQQQRQIQQAQPQQWTQPQTLTQAQYQYYYSQYPQYYHTQQVLQGTTPQGQVAQPQPQIQQVQQVQPQAPVYQPQQQVRQAQVAQTSVVHQQAQAQAAQTFQRPVQAAPQQIPRQLVPQGPVKRLPAVHRPPPPPPPIGGHRPQVPSRTTIQAQLLKTTPLPPAAASQQQQFVPSSYKLIEGNMRPAISHSKNIKTVSGASNSVFVNQNGRHEKFFSTGKNTVVRGRRNQAKGARIHRQSSWTSTKAPRRKAYPRTARTQPLTTPSPVGKRAANPSLTKN